MKEHTKKPKCKRPPTKGMIEKLRYCLRKQMNENTPCFAEEMKSSLAGLYKRGFVETKMEFINDKKILCIYITESGKEFLDSLERSGFPKVQES